MKYETMSAEQLLLYVRKMDANYKKLIEARSRILQEIKDMQERKEILSWDEIASAVAYPKVISDKERVSGGEPDSFKLLHQAERINRIFISQMEEVLEELESTETQITKYKFVERCIGKLDPDDKDVIERFTRKDLTYEDGMDIFHIGRTTLYRMQKKAMAHLLVVYNTDIRE